MSLEIGIVGLPNVGKSTLFNALTNAGAVVASYPFTTIEPNVGVVPLIDPRLDYVASLVNPQKVVPSTVRFVDIAGLVRGAHLGEGLGNQFLGHIRTVDAIAMVVRCFEDENIAHVDAQIDPIADIETVWFELTLADAEVTERRIAKVQSAAKADPKKFAPELDWLDQLRAHLNGGNKASSLSLSEQERSWASEIALLTIKPYLYVINVDEDMLPQGGERADRVRQLAAQENVEALALCAQTEMELQEWPQDDAAAYLADLGLDEPGLQRLVRAGYRMLDLITFFTATGTKTVQAWAISRGTIAPQAAGQIHSDMERGFIRAQVVSFTDLKAMGSFSEARQHGRLRVEGHDYVVQDGDVIHFLFNV
ncbi:MAG: redox-regulated ATPase YchF [Anaerolineae bacterium]|nr:redox-regulated ATPase YchF [Anaerolineae bacterium]